MKIAHFRLPSASQKRDCLSSSFLDIVPSSSADVTRALRGFFRGGSVYVASFRFKQRKTFDAVGMSSLIF